MKKIPLIIALSSLVFLAHAQNQKVQFNGVARGNIESNSLGETDTTNIDESIKGNALIDLRLDIRPSDNIRINTDLRFSNPMGGYWGQGAAIELRHISLKGVANNVFKYRFGDIDLKMTPYTLYNNNGELSANEAEIFKATREINEEENFNNGNYWHQQGADIAFRLGFDKLIETADISGFVVRNRSIEGSLIPDRLQAGGVAQFNINSKSYIGFNYINLFDVPSTVRDTSIAADTTNRQIEELQNYVYSCNFKYDFNVAYIFGEAGISKELFVDTAGITTVDIDGDFFEVGLGKKLCKNALTLEASFRRVSDDFYSAGAQSKRINLGTTPNVLNNDSIRESGLFDIVKDASIYNPTISPTLQSYNLLYNHVTPYGKATPNRMGIDVEVSYKDSAERYATSFSAQMMQETRGEGTTELRNFGLFNVYGALNVDKILQWKKTLQITAGVQYAQSSRDGLGKVEDVDFNSKAIDAGVVVELAPRFDVLVGSKLVFGKGTEYKSVYNTFNQITGYTQEHIDMSEQLNSAAIRYRFNDNVTFTIQGNMYDVAFAQQSDNDYSINQIFLLFNMKF